MSPMAPLGHGQARAPTTPPLCCPAMSAWLSRPHFSPLFGGHGGRETLKRNELGTRDPLPVQKELASTYSMHTEVLPGGSFTSLFR